MAHKSPEASEHDESVDYAARQIEKNNKSIEDQLAKNEGKEAYSVIGKMVEASQENLTRGMSADQAEEFGNMTKPLVEKFEQERDAILASDDNPEVKRSKLTLLYSTLKEELEAAQGRLFAGAAKSKQEHESLIQQQTKNQQDASERFRQDFLTALKKQDIEKVQKAQQEGREARVDHEKQERKEAKIANNEAEGKLQLA